MAPYLGPVSGSLQAFQALEFGMLRATTCIKKIFHTAYQRDDVGLQPTRTFELWVEAETVLEFQR